MQETTSIRLMLAIHAHEAICDKGADARFSGNELDHAVVFKNGNVTDDDLDTFIPAFNGYAPSGFGRMTALHLNGSNVSAQAIERFKTAVPDCQVFP
jgi:hypothetical protein